MENLIRAAQNLGVSLSKSQIELFDMLRTELTTWNEKVNLTAIRTAEDIERKHFIDSLTVMSSIPPDARSVIDVGSGAGFPGLPLAIAMPNVQFTLLEATGKKAVFLEHCKNTLGLTNVRPINARAEDLAHDTQHRESYDAAVARAVAHLPTLAEYMLPFVRVGGVCIAQKIKRAGETESAARAVTILGGGSVSEREITIPGFDDRHIIIIEKKQNTPPDFPRRAGLPSKKPL